MNTYDIAIMTNQQGAPEALRPIARYKIGYATDDWGMRSSTPSGIPDPAGAWVRYKDHIAALVNAQQPTPSAAVALSDDLRDRLVAISAAIADHDDRVAQAMLREILAAPQPSPTQAWAVPLTDEQIEALPLWRRFVGLWPETRREIVQTIEHQHGIKGGQHDPD